MKRPAALLAVALFLFPLLLIGYRVFWLGYPFLPTAPGKVWRLSMDASVKGGDKETSVSIGLPYTHADLLVIEEKIQSSALRFNLLREGENQIGVWSGVPGSSGEAFGYRAMVQVHSKPGQKFKPPRPDPSPLGVSPEERALANRLAGPWNSLDLRERLQRVAATVRGDWSGSSPDEADRKAWSTLQERHGKPVALLLLLQACGLPARRVEGLYLVESVNTTPSTWIEVWTGTGWENLHPETGDTDQKPGSLLPLVRGRLPAVRVSQGEVTEIRWILNREILSKWRMHFERIAHSNRFLDRWSLFHLPEEFQGTFRILLLVPMGALLVGVLRNVVGFPTFGIFMPVLMALAFRTTGLAYGLGIFAGVVFIGYGVRRWIDKLHLLLVPRLSLILTLVVVCVTVFALVGNKIGVREFMAVGLLPFVILTMTIERFFVIAEEAGIRQALWTSAGTAAVATITHEILHVEVLQLTFFVYPELLFAVAGAQVLLGRYGGYRLSEILRFRTFRRSP